MHQCSKSVNGYKICSKANTWHLIPGDINQQARCLKLGQQAQNMQITIFLFAWFFILVPSMFSDKENTVSSSPLDVTAMPSTFLVGGTKDTKTTCACHSHFLCENAERLWDHVVLDMFWKPMFWKRLKTNPLSINTASESPLLRHLC